MSNVIGIINYGIAGNIASINKALIKAGAHITVVDSAEQLKFVDKILLPGVGSFKDAIQELKKDDMYEGLKDAISTKPTLGVCLGMQILSKLGLEFGLTEGFGIFDAEVKPIQCKGTVPHMGFNRISVVREDKILKGVENKEFYFMHSYEVVNYRDITSLSKYAGHEFVSSISNGHVFGVQFHPEKSRDAGIQVFKNFVNI